MGIMNKKIPEYQDERKEACEALDFLECHPAINPEIMGDSLFDGFDFCMVKCCKRGVCESSSNSMVVNYGDEGWEKFQDRFKEDYEDDDTPKDMQYVYVDYEELYGEPWEFDHVEYWYETTFFVYKGNPYDISESIDYKNWERYAGPHGGAMSFEGALIELASMVRKFFGNFSCNDFMEDYEIENHKNNRAFLFEDFKSRHGYSRLLDNEEYIPMNNAIYNIRWLRWFMGTNYFSENWKFETEDFKNQISKLESNMPEKRKKLMEKYKKD